MADAAVLPEQLSSLLLRRGELDPADLTVGVVMVTRQEHERQRHAESDVGDQVHDSGGPSPSGGWRRNLDPGACHPAPHRDEEQPEPHHGPQGDEQIDRQH